MDAPEIKQVCADRRGRSYRCGLAAAVALEKLIIGQAVKCAPTGKGRYGRITATCSTPAGNLNAALVRAGWAVDYVRYSHGRYAAEQAGAKRHRRGLWKGKFEQPEAWRRKEVPP